jgi:hypothetical protein
MFQVPASDAGPVSRCGEHGRRPPQAFPLFRMRVRGSRTDQARRGADLAWAMLVTPTTLGACRIPRGVALLRVEAVEQELKAV